MNVAFQALAIFALVLPGIILREAYRRGFFWDKPRQLLPISEEIAYSLVLATGLHAIYAPIIDWLCWPIDLNATAYILLGQFGKDETYLAPSVQAITSHPFRVFSYFAVLYMLSAALGLLAHWGVRRWELDLRYPGLRFNHHWHYLLRGEIGRFPESNVKLEEKIDFLSAACVVDTSAGTLLYVGILDTFYFDRSGQLDLLVLAGAMRRPLLSEGDDAAPKEGRPSYEFIDAEYLYLKYSEIRNLAIRYVRAIEPADADGAEEIPDNSEEEPRDDR